MRLCLAVSFNHEHSHVDTSASVQKKTSVECSRQTPGEMRFIWLAHDMFSLIRLLLFILSILPY
jgi:hypothetical protein